MSEPKADSSGEARHPSTLLGRIIMFSLRNKAAVVLLAAGLVVWGVIVAPFDWSIPWLPRNPVAVDAIPDIGENQQIVFTEWPGCSPRDVEDQITYPLTTALLGIPNVRTVRSYSYFGFSSIFIIFDERAEFYWSRSRILEKLNSLPSSSLPEGVQPLLGPDATALGQVFWYTLEGRGPDGNPAGGWDLDELRSIQDWTVRYALSSAEGVAEVASIGGFVKEYQIDVDPDAMRAYGIGLPEVFDAVRASNIDVGARTIEVNRVEYAIRGLGFIKDISDIEQTVVAVRDHVPIRVSDIAHVGLGPGMRRGLLDKEGAEAVGGVVVARYGANPLAMIKHVKAKIAEIAPGLPVRAVINERAASRDQVEAFAEKAGFAAYAGNGLNHEAWLTWLRGRPKEEWPPWVTTSQVAVVPFYDRTGLIYETLGTLRSALFEEILVTIIVVLVLVLHLRSSLLISAVLPFSVLGCFIAMSLFGVDANIVALSGIAIAIGTMVDMGIVICENILKHLDAAGEGEDRLDVVYQATHEVGSAVLTAVLTTIVGFLPVFTMIGAEGKLFRPLAFTKTFCLVASVLAAIVILPPLAHVVLATRMEAKKVRHAALAGLAAAGVALGSFTRWWMGALVVAFALYHLVEPPIPQRLRRVGPWIASLAALVLVGALLTRHWLPLGPARGLVRNGAFVAVILGGVLGFMLLFRLTYGRLLRWCLNHKLAYLALPAALILFGVCAWLGFGRVFGFVPMLAENAGIGRERIVQSRPWRAAYHLLPGFGKEFMPPLDEGSYLYMPTTMPHASIGEVKEVLALQDQAIAAIPEVESVVGKLGRVESPLDPAPISMIETVINYRPEFITDEDGRRLTFAYDDERGEFMRDEEGALVPDARGRPFRQWREHIASPDDIWREIVDAAEVPGTTSAPKLQPIITRIVMLQSGMRAPMGVKVKGPDLETIEGFGLEVERLLKEVPGVAPATVFADRIVGKPYLEIAIDREAIARYGMSVGAVQEVIEVALGGKPVTMTVEGRERYGVRVRYMRELRDSIDALGRILVPGMEGAQVPLEQLAEVHYVRGPMVIKSEDTFLAGYVTFDKKDGFAEVDVVDAARRYLEAKQALGELVIPAGVSYAFAGNYENQVRAQRTLRVILPLALFVIFMILYFQFRSYVTTMLVFLGVFVAWSGGFLLLWLYGQGWFLDFSVFGVDMRALFQVHPINLSVAIWVGFLALFGIATDDGVVMATYLKQRFAEGEARSIAEVRQAALEAGERRIRPCLMTTATTILALIPVLTSTGRGADVMVPMAIPSFGGMAIELVTLFLVPVLYCWVEELKFRRRRREAAGATG